MMIIRNWVGSVWVLNIRGHTKELPCFLRIHLTVKSLVQLYDDYITCKWVLNIRGHTKELPCFFGIYIAVKSLVQLYDKFPHFELITGLRNQHSVEHNHFKVREGNSKSKSKYKLHLGEIVKAYTREKVS